MKTSTYPSPRAVWLAVITHFTVSLTIKSRAMALLTFASVHQHALASVFHWLQVGSHALCDKYWNCGQEW